MRHRGRPSRSPSTFSNRLASAIRSASSPGSGAADSISARPRRRSCSRWRPLAGAGATVRQVGGQTCCHCARETARITLDVVTQPGELIQHGALLRRSQQRDRLRLTVHRDQRVGQLGERGQRHRTSPEMCPRAPVGADGAEPRDHRAIVVEATTGGCHRRRARRIRRDRQPGLDNGPVTARADPCRVSTAAGDQSESGHDHRLACARLAGDDRESGMRLQHGVIDDAEIADPQFLQHAATVTAAHDSAGLPRGRRSGGGGHPGERERRLTAESANRRPSRAPHLGDAPKVDALPALQREQRMGLRSENTCGSASRAAGAPRTTHGCGCPMHRKRLPRRAQCRWSRQPCTGSLNLRTSRSVNA